MTSTMRQKTRTKEQEEQSEENLDENLYKHSYELSDKQSVLLPSSASTQFNSIPTSIEAEMVLFPVDLATHPPTHPPGKVSIETGEESNKKG